MPNQIPADVVAERYQRLVNLQQRISEQENAKMIGTTVEVMLQDSAGRKDDQTARVTGRARDNRLVHVGLPEHVATLPPSEQPRPGDIVTVEVTAASSHHLIADAQELTWRRTSGGDAWQRAQSQPAANSTAVSLGIPKLPVK